MSCSSNELEKWYKFEGAMSSPSVPLLHRVLRLVLPANYAIDLLQLVLNVNIKHLLHSR